MRTPKPLTTVTDLDGTTATVTGLYLPSGGGEPASYELRLRADGRWDTTDPAQRGEVRALIDGLEAALTAGQDVAVFGDRSVIAIDFPA